MRSALLLAVAAASASVVSPAGPGQRTAARYVARWTSPPPDIGGGRLSSAPLLGNGDLGVSLGGSLPIPIPIPSLVGPHRSPPPPGTIAVGLAPCNGSDPKQLWAGEALTHPGIVSQVSSLATGSTGLCLSSSSAEPVVLGSCGHGNTSWVYQNTSGWLEVAPGTGARGGGCLDADSRSSPARPNQPGFLKLDGRCQPQTEQFLFVPSTSRAGTGAGAGLLRPQCPPAVPPWQCPGLAGRCLAVISAAPPPPPPPPATGKLAVHLGLNQLWGLREYSRCTPLNADPHCVHFESDTKFPRRLAFGGVTVAPAAGTPAAVLLADATFSAEMQIATAEVVGTLTSPTSGATLSVRVVLAPGQNVALTTVTASPPMQVAVVGWVRPLDADFPRGCTPSADPTQPECLDGTASAGVAAGPIAWAQRTPLSSNSSSKPARVAMATAVLGGGGGGSAAACSKAGATSTECLVTAAGGNGTGSPVRLATVLVSSWDLQRQRAGLRRHHGPGANGGVGPDPVDAAVAAAARFTASDADALETANSAWWADFWGATSVSMPGDATLERFYYAHSYLIGSASRAGKLAPGLWGPWVRPQQRRAVKCDPSGSSFLPDFASFTISTPPACGGVLAAT